MMLKGNRKPGGEDAVCVVLIFFLCPLKTSAKFSGDFYNLPPHSFKSSEFTTASSKTSHFQTSTILCNNNGSSGGYAGDSEFDPLS